MATFVAIDKEKLETLRNAAELNVERLLASCGETNWAGEPFKLHSHLENDLNLHVWTSSVPGNRLLLFKAECFFEGFMPSQVFEFLMDNVKRLEWDKGLCDLDARIIEDNPTLDHPLNRIVMLRCNTNQVGPITGRDFLDICAHRCIRQSGEEDKDVYVSAGSTLEADWLDVLAPVRDGFVRGKNFSGGGWHISPTAAGAKVTYIIHTDLCGWFLPVIINKAIAGCYEDFFRGALGAISKQEQEQEQD